MSTSKLNKSKICLKFKTLSINQWWIYGIYSEVIKKDLNLMKRNYDNVNNF